MSASTVDNPAVRDIQDEELQIAFSGPAPHTNRYILTINGGIARLSFMEIPPSPTGQPVFRAAVSMPAADLIQIVKLIQAVARPLGIPIP